MPIRPSQAKNDIYLGTNSASANRFDSLSMTYAKNARQLPASVWTRTFASTLARASERRSGRNGNVDDLALRVRPGRIGLRPRMARGVVARRCADALEAGPSGRDHRR